MRKILIANRGEIAVRVVRACRDLGLGSVAVYSDADRAARHVRMADEACWIGPSPAADSYLRGDRLIEAALAAGADAIHPGYGFLSERASFAAACRDAGLLFIGPSPEAIALMGDKTAARQAALAAGVPVVPGTDGPLPADIDDEALLAAADAVGYPLLVKAAAGGGGKGMRLVSGPAALVDAVRAARSEALSAFGEPAVYLERRLERPRHIEVQVLADQHGTVLPFVERECSLQRRHQKVLEETPSPAVTPARRRQLADAAASIARAAGYTNAGTIEFLLDASGAFYFLEMNTRLQVEHPITEEVTGVDLVTWQIRIAAGERLTLEPSRLLAPVGHAIECRIYAEDADAGFVPSPGTITALRPPAGPGVRDDGAVETGSEVSLFYDPLLSKLVTRGEDRRQAMARMQRALSEYTVAGVRTTIPFFTWLLQEPSFVAGDVHTGWLDAVMPARAGESFTDIDSSERYVAAIAAVLAVQGEIPVSGAHPAIPAVGAAARTMPAPGGWVTGSEGRGREVTDHLTGHARLSPWTARARREALRP